MKKTTTSKQYTPKKETQTKGQLPSPTPTTQSASANNLSPYDINSIAYALCMPLIMRFEAMIIEEFQTFIKRCFENAGQIDKEYQARVEKFTNNMTTKFDKLADGLEHKSKKSK